MLIFVKNLRWKTEKKTKIIHVIPQINIFQLVAPKPMQVTSFNSTSRKNFTANILKSSTEQYMFTMKTIDVNHRSEYELTKTLHISPTLSKSFRGFF